MKRWLLCLIAGCSSAARPMATTAPAMAPTSRDPHAEIERLSAQIDQQRSQMALPAPMAASAVEPMSVPITSHTDNQCHPAQTQTCTDSCSISDSICDNAKKICDLANDLAGDTWAADKCSSATQTCKSSHEKCCACQ